MRNYHFIAFMGTSFYVSCYYDSQGSRLCKTVNYWPLPPASCKVHSGSMKASQKEGSFLVSIKLISPYFATQVCCLQQQGCTINSGGQSREILSFVWNFTQVYYISRRFSSTQNFHSCLVFSWIEFLRSMNHSNYLQFLCPWGLNIKNKHQR